MRDDLSLRDAEVEMRIWSEAEEAAHEFVERKFPKELCPSPIQPEVRRLVKIVYKYGYRAGKLSEFDCE